MRDINLDNYNYDLPQEKIAQYPVEERDMSNLLVYNGGKINKAVFRDIGDILPPDSLLVFNNTRVIRARIVFHKETGAAIEIFCIEPLAPSEYEFSLSSTNPVEWKCIIGNLKKWKSGIITTTYIYKGIKYNLIAERLKPEGEAWRIRFSWNCTEMSFGEVIEATGHVPLPPYINREDEPDDIERYQTVYSSIKGSVAAPTAGLHFTNGVLEKIRELGIKSVELTLHVGAGTFQPIRSGHITDHEMHCEHFSVTNETLELLLNHQGRIIPVGTTSVRTLESLYWLGIKILHNPDLHREQFDLGQWEPYEMDTNIPANKSLEALLKMLSDRNMSHLKASTSMMIVPGYKFRIINGMITNFHQPKSTLLLLISAWIGKAWTDIYRYALENGFRFLSYGDCSLLLR